MPNERIHEIAERAARQIAEFASDGLKPLPGPHEAALNGWLEFCEPIITRAIAEVTAPLAADNKAMREALEDVLNTCGARRTYDAIGYREAWKRAESLLGTANPEQVALDACVNRVLAKQKEATDAANLA